MAGKTVVLVTNALQYLVHADQVLWMEEGRVRAQGTYSDLVAQGECVLAWGHGAGAGAAA